LDDTTARQHAMRILLEMPITLYFSRPLNIAFHNLCANLTDCPKFLKSLLGLGLNFIPTPRYSNFNNIDNNRFITDLHTRCWFHGEAPKSTPKLFVRSAWTPPISDIPTDYRIRIKLFLQSLKEKCPGKKSSSNLLPIQRTMLQNLRNNNQLVIFPTDKNLGPAIIDKPTYIKRAISDHLSDKTTYRQLTAPQADARMKAVRRTLTNFIEKYFKKGNSDRTYLTRMLERCEDPYAYFYLLAKVHKVPWKTRPIISVSGSILQGLGQWVDSQLKIICQDLPYVIKSSYDLSLQLRTMTLPPNALLFSIDAFTMYTNIDTNHALTEICAFLATYSHPEVNVPALIHALRIIMTHNLFKFGDTFWVQLTGTAMGAPPAPAYATLYYFLHERTIIPTHSCLFFYGRYIDDGFGIWIPHPDPCLDDILWTQYLQDTTFGKLRWEATPRTKSIDFLDLTITIQNTRIVTTLFEKALNLYLYLPPHSCHSPSMTRGIIKGMIIRIFRLTSDPQYTQTYIQQFYDRLCARGYSTQTLRPIFLDAISSISTMDSSYSSTTTCADSSTFYLHVRYHPNLPSSRIIQRDFQHQIVHPCNDYPVSYICNHRNVRLPQHLLTVAYHRPPNLGNLLSCRKMDTGVPVSMILRDETRDTINPNPNPTFNVP
jgi:hypothetical protein